MATGLMTNRSKPTASMGAQQPVQADLYYANAELISIGKSAPPVELGQKLKQLNFEEGEAQIAIGIIKVCQIELEQGILSKAGGTSSQSDWRPAGGGPRKRSQHMLIGLFTSSTKCANGLRPISRSG